MPTSFERKRSVCIFCEKWGSGGIESFLLNYLERMDMAQVDITLVTASVESTLFFPRLEQLRIPIHVLSGNYRNVLKNHAMFRKLLRQNFFDVIHVNAFVSTSFLYLVDAKKSGVSKRILHSHNNAFRNSRLRPLKQLLHEIGKQFCTAVITDYWACSKAAAQFMFPQRVQTNVKIIPNGILLERFLFCKDVRNRVREELGITTQLVIGNIGRLCYQKNQEFLLLILKQLLLKRTDVCLLLIGGGDQTELNMQAEQLGIRESVFFLGTTDRIEQYLWAMDLFVFPSRFEGLGIAALEAQAAGLPVIGSENLPQEVMETPIFYKRSLADSPKVWAEEILYRVAPRSEHIENIQLLRDEGYDVTHVAQIISTEYRT